MSNRLQWKWLEEERTLLEIRSRLEILALLDQKPDWGAYFRWLTHMQPRLGQDFEQERLTEDLATQSPGLRTEALSQV